MSHFAAKSISLGEVNFSLVSVESQPHNGSVFFQTRDGLWVSPNLARYIGLDDHITQGTPPTGRVLKQDESEADLFGKPGSIFNNAILMHAIDLGQIQALIEAQWDGGSGVLLTNGYANLFPVKGKEGTLLVVRVTRYAADPRWDVNCSIFSPGVVLKAGLQVFSN